MLSLKKLSCVIGTALLPDMDNFTIGWYLTNGKNNSVKPKYPRKNWVLQTTEYEREDELI